MSNRKGLVLVAACAAVAVSGWARAGEPGPASTFPDTALTRVQLLQQDAPARAPLMSLLGGAAKPLEDAGISIGGRVEGSLTYSASAPPGNVIAGRVFDFEHEDPTLNQVGLVLNKDVDSSKFDVGGRVEWIYGADARLIHSLGLFDHMGVGDGPDNQWDLNQAYVDVALGGGWKVRAGKFVALAGYEVIDPTGNELYSHSFMFGYAIPFTHTGVLATHKVNDRLSYSFGGSRGWDTTLEDNNGTADILGQIAYTTDDAKNPTQYILNVTTGPDQPGDNGNWRTLLDLIVVQKVGDNLKLVLNADYAYEANSVSSVSGSDAQWFGVAGYAVLKTSDMVSLTARAEYFNDQDGARLTGGVGGASLYEATLGLQITPMPNDAYGRGLVIRPEVRFDYCEDSFFDGGSDYYQFTAAIDAVYKF